MNDNGKTYRVMVFGKEGCPKCDVLKDRLGKTLGKGDWADFDQEYFSVKTPRGLVAFSRAQCINPNRIPAMVVAKRDPATGAYEMLPNPQPGEEDKVCQKSRLYQYLGLQTDYTEVGKGVITPKMITSILEQAKGL